MNLSTKISLTLILVLTALLSLSFYYAKPFVVKRVNQSRVPDWYIVHAKITNTNLLGHVTGQLTSPRLTHLPYDNVIHLQTPFFVAYDKTNIPWHIHADKGLAYQTKPKKINLIGNVRIQQLPGVGSHKARLTTTQMMYFPNQNIAETKQPVTISEPGTVMHSVGFKANFHQGVIRFLSRSEAEYYDVK